jgi:hypothetical protein
MSTLYNDNIALRSQPDYHLYVLLYFKTRNYFTNATGSRIFYKLIKSKSKFKQIRNRHNHIYFECVCSVICLPTMFLIFYFYYCMKDPT